VLRYRQHADHRKPNGERFEQRITLWHSDFADNHGSNIGQLPAAQRDEVTHILQSWMGVTPNVAVATTTAELTDPGARKAGFLR
jgi:hypothetical protein